MWHIIEHSILDSITLVPFLFLTYLAMEYLEHKAGDKTARLVRKAGKWGPLIGGVAGVVPQCGFSAAASNLYAGRVISVGTLLAIYLSTSDEALLVMLTKPNRILDILAVMGIKFAIALVAGYIIDLILRKRKSKSEECHHCHHHGDSCDDEELIGEAPCCSHTNWKAIIKCTL